MLFTTENVGFGRGVDVEGGLGVAVDFSRGVRDLLASSMELAAFSIETGDGEAKTLGMEVETGYLLLTSAPPPPRVMNHAIRTPEAPSTRTIANTQGKTPLRDSLG
jgi:hypothetical protein